MHFQNFFSPFGIVCSRKLCRTGGWQLLVVFQFFSLVVQSKLWKKSYLYTNMFKPNLNNYNYRFIDSI